MLLTFSVPSYQRLSTAEPALSGAGSLRRPYFADIADEPEWLWLWSHHGISRIRRSGARGVLAAGKARCAVQASGRDEGLQSLQANFECGPPGAIRSQDDVVDADAHAARR